MLYPEKYIYDISGFPVIKAGELITNLKKQMQPFQCDVCLEEEVTYPIQEADGLLRLDTIKDTHYSRTAVFAIGNGAFQPRHLTTGSVEVLEGESVHYHATDMKEFIGKKVAIADGGDSATDWALALENVVKEVSIIHHRPQFHGYEHNMEQLEKSSISIRTPYIISDILEENETFTGVQLAETKGDQTPDLPLDDLIINYGSTPSPTYLKEWGSDVSRNTINVHFDMSTNIPDIYTVGDICSHEGKVKLTATSLGRTPTAVDNVLHYLRSDARCQPVHSTGPFENGAPK